MSGINILRFNVFATAFFGVSAIVAAVVFDGVATVELNESAARKLVDDILRNANYMWPVEEESGD